MENTEKVPHVPVEFTPKFIRQELADRPGTVIESDRWNELFNLNIIQGDYNTETLAKLIEDYNQYAGTVDGAIGEIDLELLTKLTLDSLAAGENVTLTPNGKGGVVIAAEGSVEPEDIKAGKNITVSVLEGVITISSEDTLTLDNFIAGDNVTMLKETGNIIIAARGSVIPSDIVAGTNMSVVVEGEKITLGAKGSLSPANIKAGTNTSIIVDGDNVTINADGSLEPDDLVAGVNVSLDKTPDGKVIISATEAGQVPMLKDVYDPTNQSRDIFEYTNTSINTLATAVSGDIDTVAQAVDTANQAIAETNLAVKGNSDAIANIVATGVPNGAISFPKLASDVVTNNIINEYTQSNLALTGVGRHGTFKATSNATTQILLVNGISYSVRRGTDTEVELTAGTWESFILDEVNKTINFISGGAGSLDITVIAQTERPTSPKENTIFINTLAEDINYSLLKEKGTLNGWLQDDGTIYVNSAYFISEYLPIYANATFSNTAEIGFVAKQCWYDKDKNFISSFNFVQSGTVPAGTYSLPTPPVNAVYVRFSLQSADSGKATYNFLNEISTPLNLKTYTIGYEYPLTPLVGDLFFKVSSNKSAYLYADKKQQVEISLADCEYFYQDAWRSLDFETYADSQWHTNGVLYYNGEISPIAGDFIGGTKQATQLYLGSAYGQQYTQRAVDLTNVDYVEFTGSAVVAGGGVTTAHYYITETNQLASPPIARVDFSSSFATKVTRVDVRNLTGFYYIKMLVYSQYSSNSMTTQKIELIYKE